MKIIYDNLIYSLQRVGGISVYWYELSKRLLAEQEVDIKFYETGLESQNILRSLLEIDHSAIQKSKRVNLMVERFLKLPAVEEKNVFHSSYFRIPERSKNTKIVSTIHDFTHDLYYSGPRVWLHNNTKRKAIESSDVIITVSEHTKTDLMKFYPKIDEKRIVTVYNGVSEDFYQVENISQIKDDQYVLFIGSREHYKNFDFTVNLISKLTGFKLYIVGSKLTQREEKFVKESLGNRCEIFTGINNQKLNELYNRAFCLIYPSFYEGFGIPLVEAMRAGCPFIALNTSSIPEVAGNAGILLLKLDLKLAIEALENIKDNRMQLVKEGLNQSKKFSWDDCYNNTFKIYRNLYD